MVSDCAQGLKITAKSLILQHYCQRSEPFFTLTYPTPIFQSSHYIFIQIQFKSYSKVHLTQFQYSKVLQLNLKIPKLKSPNSNIPKLISPNLSNLCSILNFTQLIQLKFDSKAHLTQLNYISKFTFSNSSKSITKFQSSPYPTPHPSFASLELWTPILLQK